MIKRSQHPARCISILCPRIRSLEAFRGLREACSSPNRRAGDNQIKVGGASIIRATWKPSETRSFHRVTRLSYLFRGLNRARLRNPRRIPDSSRLDPIDNPALVNSEPRLDEPDDGRGVVSRHFPRRRGAKWRRGGKVDAFQRGSCVIGCRE